jgi:DNA mismatch repair protein MutL
LSEIRLLDDVTIGQIAAGEIIERPASVVKELVENAVDAGARRVTISAWGGGIDALEIADDGDGIAPDQLPLAVRRHATSKLRETGDLQNIATLGFRGEGLAAICAVAELELVSRTAGHDIGQRVVAFAEEARQIEPVAAPPGTRVRVERLFANVPVRREYLRSAQTEFARISSWLSMFSLAYPKVAFELRNDDKTVWNMPATADARERLAMVFGRDAATMLELDRTASRSVAGSIGGFVSAPGHDRGDRRLQLLFVNRRLLRSTLLSGAWSAAYSTFVMTGRYPYGVLFLELPAEQVDANVHPTKSDVRLRHGTQGFDAVRRAMSATLQQHAAGRFREHTAAAGVSYLPGAPRSIDTSLEHMESLFAHAAGDPDDVPAPRMRVLAQLAATYIVATDDRGLLLVDQHAAHERIAYETIERRARERAPCEALLVPRILELDATRSAALETAMPALLEAGLEIETFGDQTYRIVATPAGYGARTFDVDGFIEELTSDPKERGVREKIWASLACHSVTVAGERLEPQEMTTLVDRLAQCINAMHCPHGRPTMVRLSAGEIARLFKRV